MPDLSRVRVVRIALAAGFLASVLISYPLWTGAGRLYPRAPAVVAIEGVERWAPWWEVPLAAALCAALAGVALARTARGAAGAAAGALVALLLLAVADQTRWQPWAYQYALMLLALALPFPARERAARTPDAGALRLDGDVATGRRLNAWRVVVALTYFWSGVQKLAGGGSGLLLPLARPLAEALSVGEGRMLLLLNACTAAVEVAVGVGLLTARFRRPALAGAVLTHAMIVVLLATVGLNPAIVVWPWNLALAAIAVALFRDARDGPGWREVLAPRQGGAHAAALLLVGVMPAFSLAGRWDPYLSAALYSGNTGSAYVQWSGGGAGAPADPVPSPPALADSRSSDRRLVGLPQWAMSELRVAGYPALRVHRQLARRLCDRARPSHRLVLVTRRRLTVAELARRLVARRRGEALGAPQRIWTCAMLAGTGGA